MDLMIEFNNDGFSLKNARNLYCNRRHKPRRVRPVWRRGTFRAEIMNISFKTRSFVFKMMNFAGGRPLRRHVDAERRGVEAVAAWSRSPRAETRRQVELPDGILRQRCTHGRRLDRLPRLHRRYLGLGSEACRLCVGPLARPSEWRPSSASVLSPKLVLLCA